MVNTRQAHLIQTGLTIVLALTLLLGCTSTDHQAETSRGGPNQQDSGSSPSAENFTWLRSELYFGMNKPGGIVTKLQFRKFVDDVVTPKFPNGFTTIDAEGQWFNTQTQLTEKEKTKVLIVCHPDDASSIQKLEFVARSYRVRFSQQSVMRVTQPARVVFH